MTGVYKITNMINGKKYIGQSGDLKYRWTHHKSDLRGGIHHNRHLQSAWDIYGENNFEFEVIEECDYCLLDEKEKYWIAYYQSNNPEYGYNLDSGGKGIRGYKHTPEEIEKMRRIQSPIIILQFDLNFNLVKRWIGGSSQIRKEFGATKESIDYRCNHKINTMSPYKGFYWVYEEEFQDERFRWDRYLNNEIIKQVYIPSKKSFKEPIYQYDFDKNLLNEYNNAFELEKAGYSMHIVGTLLNRNAHIKTYKNSIWCYKSYDFSDGYYDYLFRGDCRSHDNKKPILQIDCNTKEIICEYPSLIDAIKKNNCSYNTLIQAAKSNLTQKYHGYYWQYKQ